MRLTRAEDWPRHPDLVTRLAELPSGAAKRMMGLAPEALTKFGALGADEFGKIARLGERSLQKLAALEPGVLAKLAKLNLHLSFVADLNPAAIEWLSELSPTSWRKSRRRAFDRRTRSGSWQRGSDRTRR